MVRVPRFVQTDHQLGPISLSVASFDLSRGADVHLSYSLGCEHGPIIRRRGDSAPYMQCLWDPNNPFSVTTDADEQRLGAWFLDAAALDEEVSSREDVAADLAAAQKAGDNDRAERLGRRLATLDRIIDDGRRGGLHEEHFLSDHPGRQIIGQQGCGDLTMNLWYVAYLCSRLTKDRPRLLWPYDEPITDREYTCLVKWKSPLRVTVEEGVRFRPGADDGGSVHIDGRTIQEGIEFAVYGKPAIWDGEAVRLRRVVNQYADLRHLFQLPNVNPAEPLYKNDPAPQVGAGRGARRVRKYYGKYWRDDVWLAERQLLDDPNLQRSAVDGPVVLDRLYGGMDLTREELMGAMDLAGYAFAKDPHRIEIGEWTFAAADDRFFEVHLRPNRYPWGMIGANRSGSRVLCLAANGHQGRAGYTLAEAVAEFLRANGGQDDRVWRALVMDEGNDVFQRVLTHGVLETKVPPRRRQLRAQFIFSGEA